MTDDLIERLRAGVPNASADPAGYEANVALADEAMEEAADRIATQQEALREARKWIAGQPDRSTSIYATSFAMLEAIDAALSGERT